MLNLSKLVTFLAVATLATACATTGAPKGPPAQCLLNAETVGIQENKAATNAGLSSNAAQLYGVGERNNARVACAILGVIVVRTDERLSAGLVTPTRAYAEADQKLRQLATSAMPGDVGARMAGWAQPFIPRTATAFHADLTEWKELVRQVEGDRNIPAAKTIIASARERMQAW